MLQEAGDHRPTVRGYATVLLTDSRTVPSQQDHDAHVMFIVLVFAETAHARAFHVYVSMRTHDTRAQLQRWSESGETKVWGWTLFLFFDTHHTPPELASEPASERELVRPLAP